jgi:RNA polymerase sigma-70 factor (ECF subfamily)
MIDATVSRAKAGDVDAINAVLGNIAGFVKKHIHAQLGRHCDLDDVSQDVLIKVYRRLPTCKAETVSGFYSWVGAICRTTCLDFHKARKPVQNLGDYDTIGPGDVFLGIEAQEVIYAAASASNTVDEVRLSVAGCSQSEIGRRLGVQKRSVQAKLERHREKVRSMLAEPVFFSS